MEKVKIPIKLAIECYALLGSIEFETETLEEKRENTREELEKIIK